MKGEENKDVLEFNFIRRKLDFMSGTIYTIEGLARNILIRIKDNSTKLDNILDKIDKNIEPDLSDAFFAKVQIDNIIIEGRISKITMNEFQQVSATYAAEKKDGSPAKVENARAEVDRTDVATVEIDTEAQRVTVKPIKGAITEDTPVAVRVVADADIGEGEREIEIVGAVLITVGEAEKLTLTFEEPTDLV